MDAYLRMFRIDDEDKMDFFLRMIPQLDNLWMEDWAKRAEQERTKKKQ